jgi:hypothetical protein
MAILTRCVIVRRSATRLQRPKDRMTVSRKTQSRRASALIIPMRGHTQPVQPAVLAPQTGTVVLAAVLTRRAAAGIRAGLMADNDDTMAQFEAEFTEPEKIGSEAGQLCKDCNTEPAIDPDCQSPLA